MTATLNIFNNDTLGVWQTVTANTLWRGQLLVFQEQIDYPAVNRFLKRADEEQGGKQLEWQAVIDDDGNAQWANEADAKTYTATDAFATFSTQWKLLTSDYLVFKSEVQAGVESKNVLVLQDLLKSRRARCAMSLASKLEARLWSVPTGSTEEQAKQPYGIPYSVVPITSTQVAASKWGFQGANHTSYSACYGVDSSLSKYARYRNFNDVWSSDLASNELSEDDIDKILRLLRHMKWTAPINAKQFLDALDGPRMEFWCGERLITLADRKARANNDSLGSDLGKFAGQTNTKGIVWNWGEKLDAETTSPLIAIDMDSFRTIVRRGENLVEDGPRKLPNIHRAMVTDVDLVCANVNRNRRKCGRIDYVA